MTRRYCTVYRSLRRGVTWFPLGGSRRPTERLPYFLVGTALENRAVAGDETLERPDEEPIEAFLPHDATRRSKTARAASVPNEEIVSLGAPNIDVTVQGPVVERRSATADHRTHLASDAVATPALVVLDL